MFPSFVSHLDVQQGQVKDMAVHHKGGPSKVKTGNKVLFVFAVRNVIVKEAWACFIWTSDTQCVCSFLVDTKQLLSNDQMTLLIVDVFFSM